MSVILSKDWLIKLSENEIREESMLSISVEQIEIVSYRFRNNQKIKKFVSKKIENKNLKTITPRDSPIKFFEIADSHWKQFVMIFLLCNIACTIGLYSSQFSIHSWARRNEAKKN